MSDHKFILNTFKMYFDVTKEPLNQHTKELLDMVDLGLNPIASEYNLKNSFCLLNDVSLVSTLTK